MIDTSFIDTAKDLSIMEIYETEISQLYDIAKHIGSFEWQYDGDNKLHDGPIAQALLLCPGLKDAVINVDGTLHVDTQFVALATLGYVAALTRILTGIQLEHPTETIAQAEQVEANNGVAE